MLPFWCKHTGNRYEITINEVGCNQVNQCWDCSSGIRIENWWKAINACQLELFMFGLGNVDIAVAAACRWQSRSISDRTTDIMDTQSFAVCHSALHMGQAAKSVHQTWPIHQSATNRPLYSLIFHNCTFYLQLSSCHVKRAVPFCHIVCDNYFTISAFVLQAMTCESWIQYDVPVH